jgi:hypothetical protein
MASDESIVRDSVSIERYNFLLQRAYDKAYNRSDEAQVLATLALAEATLLSSAARS